MYTVDKLDKVWELADAPWPNAGAPLPVLISNEHQLFLAYIADALDSSIAGELTPQTGELPIAIVSFQYCRAHMFGPPNDEAFFGHPLANRGLRPYAVFEIERSSWIRQLERMNSVHPSHKSWMFDSYRHFIFAFHDSTFEVVADGFEVEMMLGSIDSALFKIVKMME